MKLKVKLKLIISLFCLSGTLILLILFLKAEKIKFRYFRPGSIVVQIDQSSESAKLSDLLIINSSKAKDIELNLSIFESQRIFQQHFNTFEFANDLPEIKSAFERNHPIEWINPESNLDPSQALSRFPNQQNTLLIWFVGHNIEPTYSNLNNDNSVPRLDWKTPWVGKSNPNVSELATALSQSLPGRKTVYLAPTCFSERIHRLSYQNPTTCGIGNAAWNRASLFSKAEGTALSRLFFESINKAQTDLGKKKLPSLFESYVYIFRNDYFNYPNIQLSSSAYIRNFSNLPFKNTETFEPWNIDDQREIWNRLYRDIRSFKINSDSVCASVEISQASNSKTKALFSDAELKQLPANYRKNLLTWMKSICDKSDPGLLTLERIFEAEQFSSEIRNLKALSDACRAPGWNGFDPRFTQYWAQFIEAIKNSQKSFTPSYQPHFENCANSRMGIFDAQVRITNLLSHDRHQLSPIPILVQAKKIALYLNSSNNASAKNKLIEILECENSQLDEK